MPPDERSRRLGQPAARRTPHDTIAEGTTSIADLVDAEEWETREQARWEHPHLGESVP